MDKTRTVGQKWLANELNLHFLTLNKCTKFQSNRSILSKVIVYTDRQTILRNLDFRVQGVSKRGHLTKKRGGGPILDISNTFSDENVTILFENCEFVCKYFNGTSDRNLGNVKRLT